MTVLLLVLFLAPSADRELAAADALAARVRTLEGKAKDAALRQALEAYAAILKAHGKDRRLVPRVRRKRAKLLARAERIEEALVEHDAIVEGRARRRDRGRALHDGALLLERSGKLPAAEARLKRVLRDYGDLTSTCAKASLARGRILLRLERRKDAAAAYRLVTDRFRDEAKEAIAAYDALALMAIEDGKPALARRWLQRCVARYRKRAARDDRYGAFLRRQLGAMKSPKNLAEKGS